MRTSEKVALTLFLIGILLFLGAFISGLEYDGKIRMMSAGIGSILIAGLMKGPKNSLENE